MSMLNRLPQSGQIIPVYAVGATILYSWAVLNAIKDMLSNWSLYLNISEIFGLFSYTMAGTFFESLVFISFLLIISFLLPKKLFTDKFIVRGSILTVTFLGSIIYLYTQTFTYQVLENIGTWAVFFLCVTLPLLLLGERCEVAARFIKLVADRCIIFLYIYLPISFISAIVILARNVS